MTLTKTERDKVLTLLRSGETPASIARVVKISRASVYRVIHELSRSEIGSASEDKDKDKDKNKPEQSHNKENEEKTENQENKNNEPQPSKEVNKEKEGAEHIEDKLITRTIDGYITKASTELSTMLKDDLVISLNAGAILRREELLHRAEVEEVGLKWEEYVQWCMETGYQLFERVLIQKIQEEEINERKITPEKVAEANIIANMGRL
jgi:hypothetical protein